jgi:hypothetical protein
MGLLDEAIREHLELKRRGGADPTAVARDEHEALAPVFPEEPAEASTLGQDTAELDMRTVIGEEPLEWELPGEPRRLAQE